MDSLTPDQLLEETAACVAEIRERTEIARIRAERGLTETLDAVGEVLRLATAAVDAREPSIREAAVLDQALSRHDELLDQFVTAVAETTQTQVVLERKAHAHTSEVRTISRAMAGAASSSRLVAINALINANALATGQATLAALAQEMQHLSGIVQASSADVAGIANRLAGILPRLDDCAGRIASTTENFATEVGAERDIVRGAIANLDQALEDARDGAITDTDSESLNRALSFGSTVGRCLDALEDAASIIEDAASPPAGADSAAPLVAC